MKFLKKFFIVVILISLWGCGDSSIINKPFPEAGNQTFTMSSEFETIIKAANGNVSFNQLDKEHILFKVGIQAGFDYYIYNISDSSYKDVIVHDNYHMVYFDYNNERITYLTNNQQVISCDYNGNVIKTANIDDIGTVAPYYSQGYIVVLVTPLNGARYINVYDLELNKVKKYDDMTLGYVNAKSESFSNLGITNLDSVITSANNDLTKIYKYSDGKFTLLTDKFQGNVVQESYINDIYFFTTKDTFNNIYYYAVIDGKLKILSDDMSNQTISIVSLKGDTELSNFSSGSNKFELFDSTGKSTATVTEPEGTYLFNGADSYFVWKGPMDVDSNNVFEQYSLDGKLINTYKLPSDGKYIQASIKNFDGKIILTVKNFKINENIKVDENYLLDNGVTTKLSKFIYDMHSDAFVTISDDSSPVVNVYKNGEKINTGTFDQPASITDFLLVNNEIAFVRNNTISYFKYDGTLINTNNVLAKGTLADGIDGFSEAMSYATYLSNNSTNALDMTLN